jgi:hypothetical protein
MSEAARQFLAALVREEEHFLTELKLDEGGLGMLTAIKEFDFYLWNYHRHERTDDTEQHVFMLRLGLPKLIAGILGQIPRLTYPIVTFRSPEILVLGALDQVMALGCIEQGRRLAHAALAGECEIRQVDARTFEAVLPNPTFNMEQHEDSVERHYSPSEWRRDLAGLHRTLKRIRVRASSRAYASSCAGADRAKPRAPINCAG